MAKCKECFHWNACKKMLKTYWGHCVPSDYEGGADRCEDFISTANVIVLTGIIEGHPDPVGEPGDSAIDVAKLEVAREIFEEIEKKSCTISETNFAAGHTRVICYQISSETLQELKKKYTEGQK